MKWIWFLLLAAVVVAQDESVLPIAEDCDPDQCQPPNCRCSSTDIPGGLDPRDTPQFVTVTYDDAINIINIETYRDTVYNRNNLNGCKAGATFFVNHEYTNYQLVNELYNQGFEIALHSISHRTPQEDWMTGSTEMMRREFLDQRIILTQFGNIPLNAIHGLRIPFLQMAGNTTFSVMSEGGLTYDSTWPTISYVDPGLWPYTLDFASIQDCVTPPCPSASIPGVWVLPMITWRDLQGVPCAMVDACFPSNTPPYDDEDGWFQFIVGNFERHYLGNRAPFGFYVHEWFFATNPAVKNAFNRFLDLINNLHDVFMVNSHEVIDWVKNPVPVNQYYQQPCKQTIQTNCPSVNCGPLNAAHNGLDYWMAICNVCPNSYPWVDNPLGL